MYDVQIMDVSSLRKGPPSPCDGVFGALQPLTGTVGQ
jgi:hypothetical protein